MITVIAEILKARLANLIWIERFGGFVSQATRPEFVSGADGAQIVKGYQTYPVSRGVNMENCWENGAFKHFEPDSGKSAIAFFTDNGGVSLRGTEGPRNSFLKFNFDLKFLCWMNTVRLGDDITGGEFASGSVTPYVIAQLFGEHTPVGLFDGGVIEEVYQAVEVTGIREMTKNPSMFEPFTFARDGVNRGLFIYPYDYFGLSITGTFVFNRNCLPDFGVDWEPFVGCLSPGSGGGTPGGGTSNWFNVQMLSWLAGLDEYDSDESAALGGVAYLSYYRTADNHVSESGGLLKQNRLQ